MTWGVIDMQLHAVTDAYLARVVVLTLVEQLLSGVPLVGWTRGFRPFTHRTPESGTGWVIIGDVSGAFGLQALLRAGVPAGGGSGGVGVVCACCSASR